MIFQSIGFFFYINSELYADKEHFSGASIYKFPTTSKRGAMAQKADLNRRKDSMKEEGSNTRAKSPEMKLRRQRKC